MRLHHRSTLASFALKTLTGAVASAVFVTSAYAAGLGKLTVHSALGQPLNAEIELTSVSSDEASGLVAKLAAPDAFRLANIEFNPALMSLRFAVEQRGNRQFIKITSTQPLNEPFVDMLLELNWSGGRLVREYTFLLDPAEIRTTQPAQVAAASAQGARAGQNRAAQAPRQAAQPAAAPARQSAAADGSAGADSGSKEAISEYTVKRGDTLGKIAREIRPTDISLDMMLVALYRANPDAFAGNNMNRLKSGTILSVPDSQAIKGSVNNGEARGVVVAHAADFNAYRNKLAGQVATAAPDPERAANQSAAGKITAQVKERPTAASESQDKLRLSKAASGSAAAAAGAAMSAEEKIAKDKALAEATARVKELERNVSELENLMAVKSKTASEVAKPPVAAAPAAAPAAPAAATPAATPANTPAATPAPAAIVDKPAKPAKPPKQAKPAPAPAEPTLADTIMDNITGIALGLGAILAAALGVVALRRRKAAADANGPSEPSMLGAPTDQAHSLFAETGGQSVDTNNSVFNSSFAPSASQLDTNEVDPVAEADVYIAYGRDAQAEEILKEALRTHPERMPVRLKLLEIYAARKDLRAFETQATEMYSITRGQGDDWAQAAALGLSLDAANPLYAGAGNAAPVTPAPSAEEAGQKINLSKQVDEVRGTTPPNSRMDLDLDLSNDSTVVPAAVAGATAAAVAVPVAAAAAAPAEDDHSLDFDLGGLSFEPINAEPVKETDPLGAAPRAEEEPLIDFSQPDSVTPVAAPAPALATTADEEPYEMAFDMSFDSAEEAKAVPAAVPVAEQRGLDDFGINLIKESAPANYGTVDLTQEYDLPALPETTVAAPAPQADHDFDTMDFDLSPVDAAPAPVEPQAKAEQADEGFFDLDLPGSEPAQPAAAPQFDISSIDLDLPADQSSASQPSLDDSPTALPQLDVGNDFGDVAPAAEPEELSAVHMEMETKLDLAIAYQEIGDKEGARELLDEVIKGGSSEQVGRANEMRAKLA